MAKIIQPKTLELEEQVQGEDPTKSDADVSVDGIVGNTDVNSFNTDVKAECFSRVLSTYIISTDRNLLNNYSNEDLKAVSKYLTYGNRLTLSFKELDRDSFIDLVNLVDKDLGELLRLTNLKELFPEEGIRLDGTTRTQSRNSVCLTAFNNIETTYGRFLRVSGREVIIPDVHALPLFLTSDRSELLASFLKHQAGGSVSKVNSIGNSIVKIQRRDGSYKEFGQKLPSVYDILNPKAVLDYIKYKNDKPEDLDFKGLAEELHDINQLYVSSALGWDDNSDVIVDKDKLTDGLLVIYKNANKE
ncbi:hypothetical protein HN385_02485 [archaeon]|jgi:hypothetical protein|nr:hypothetical protein [archaeon]MBT3450785.1 hypothetical protein [archaeon]MBT6868802.1 hypothetical protein [archaeon]MBT7192977.1 hypothetical protein [archaeon]MBT7380943.1 hypothetical protein [archaeon]